MQGYKPTNLLPICQIVQNNRGLSLVQVLVMIGITAIFSMGVTSIATIQNKSQFEMNLKSSILAIRQNTIGVMANQAAWERTRTLNNGMRCQSPNQANCNALAGHSARLVNIYNSNGDLIVNSLNPQAGFTSFGEPCQSFSAAGNNNCPIRLVATWRAACTTATCTSTLFTADELISLDFVYAPKDSKGVPLNPQNFNLVEQNRLRISDNSSPVLSCADNGRIFIGVGKVFRGLAADPQGCVAYSAFQGVTGNPGPTGATGSTGAMGPAGPAGQDAICP